MNSQDELLRNTGLGRRAFIKAALATTAFAAMGIEGQSEPRDQSAMDRLIDVNVNVARWPLRRLRYDDPAALVGLLRKQGVSQAWAGSFDGLLHKDLAAVNGQLARECQRPGRGFLLPFGSINPKSPDWEEDLRRCCEQFGMPGIRLHPNYHGYKLDDPDFARLLSLATQRRLIVQLALIMEDERMMHPRLRVEPVDPAPLAGVVKQTVGLRLVLLNSLGKLQGRPLAEVMSAGEVYVELAMLEGVGAVARLLSQVPANRVLFGSHAPFFYFQSATLKLKESALNREQLRALGHGNAQQLLASVSQGRTRS